MVRGGVLGFGIWKAAIPGSFSEGLDVVDRNPLGQSLVKCFGMPRQYCVGLVWSVDLDTGVERFMHDRCERLHLLPGCGVRTELVEDKFLGELEGAVRLETGPA